MVIPDSTEETPPIDNRMFKDVNSIPQQKVLLLKGTSHIVIHLRPGITADQYNCTFYAAQLSKQNSLETGASVDSTIL